MKSLTRRALERLDRDLSKLLRATDPVTVPVQNAWYDAVARRFPDRHLRRVEESIRRGLGFFEAQEELTFDAAATFTAIVSDAFEPGIAALHHKVRAYWARWNDPHLRLLDARYDPLRRAGSAAEVNTSGLSHVETPLIPCLYVDRTGGAKEALRSLEDIDDDGGYGTTHKLVGCMILKAFSPDPDPAVDEAIASTIGPMVSKQRTARARDIFFERTVLLQWVGHGEAVRPAWIVRILDSQMDNGGWYWNRALVGPRADQHPSALALAALIQYRDRQTRVPPTAPPVLGHAFPLDP
jgi:hypothetical protein